MEIHLDKMYSHRCRKRRDDKPDAVEHSYATDLFSFLLLVSAAAPSKARFRSLVVGCFTRESRGVNEVLAECSLLPVVVWWAAVRRSFKARLAVTPCPNCDKMGAPCVRSEPPGVGCCTSNAVGGATYSNSVSG